MISLSYSRISLADIAQKLQLDSPEDAEFIVAKVTSWPSGPWFSPARLPLPPPHGFRLRPLQGVLGTLRAPRPLSVCCVLSPLLLLHNHQTVSVGKDL